MAARSPLICALRGPRCQVSRQSADRRLGAPRFAGERAQKVRPERRPLISVARARREARNGTSGVSHLPGVRTYRTASEPASCSVSSSRELCSWAKRRGPRISAIRSWAAPASA